MADTTETTVTHYVSVLRWEALKREFRSRQTVPSTDQSNERR